FLIHKLRRDNTKRWKPSWKSGADLFEDCRFFVACEADEDLPYLTQYIGEDHLLTGSDYGHNDPAEQTHLVATMKAREDMPAGLVQKILCDNPRKFYGIRHARILKKSATSPGRDAPPLAKGDQGDFVAEMSPR